MPGAPSIFQSSKAQTIGWALYLACSWTWCIGMFLPVLMVRDFGFAGWVVFAIPNVLGAAALGWVLSRPGKAQQIVAQHAFACQCFSGVTIAFQFFFLAWVVRGLVGWPGFLAGMLIALAMWLVTRGGRRERILATIVFLISVAAICFCIIHEGVLPRILPAGLRHGEGLNLLFLSPVVVFGFLFCPYLDLTFLRARSLTAPNSGIAAFTLGFGLFFPLMIAFTLWYAPLLQSGQFSDVPRVLAAVIAAHMLIQCGFTIALHMRPLTAKDAAPVIRWSTLALSLIVILLPQILNTRFSPIASSVHNEHIYRLFMAFYALIFPAYVWICMIPARQPMSRARLIVLMAAILIAAPMFWLGFMAGKMIWLIPGLAIILGSRFIVPAFEAGPAARNMPSGSRIANS